MTTGAGTDTAVETTIRPFRVQIAQADLDSLAERLANTRWPADVPGIDWAQGVPLAYLRRLADYWRTSYDWRAAEAALNELPQFVTAVDGQTVHFVHVRSPEPTAMPLVLGHGYPNTFVEYQRIIGPLTDPRAHGGDPADAYHVVVPSLPGLGFSTPLSDATWDIRRTARSWAEIMRRLGYDRYFAHGGDIGAGVVGDLGKVAPDSTIAVHVNTEAGGLALLGGMLPDQLDGLTPAEADHLDRLRAYERDGRGYLQIQTTRPQTLGYALTDSPVGQLAWIVEKFKEWTDLGADDALPDGSVDLDQMLTTVSLYWFGRGGHAAALLIYANTQAEGDWTPSRTPTGFAEFDCEDGLLRKILDADGSAAHWSTFDHGGHFPAMAVPDLLVGDIRAFFRRFR